METVYIRRAFEKQLKLIDPTFPTAYENVSFTPNENAYQRCKLVPSRPENPSIGDGYYRETGQFIIFLCYPVNTGTLEAFIKASNIREHFERGLSFTESGIQVRIESTPQIAGGMNVEDRYIVPVIIEYFADILKV